MIAATAGRISDDTISFGDLPSPPGPPLLGNLLELDRSRIHLVLEQWARRHGPSFRLRFPSTDALVLAAPDDIQHVLRSRPGTFRRLHTIEAVMADMGVTGVISAEGEQWKRQR